MLAPPTFTHVHVSRRYSAGVRIGAASFTLDRRSGRFIEIRFFASLSLEDVTALRTRLWTQLSQLDSRAVVWADLRDCELFSPEVATKLIEMLRVDNPRV